MSIEIDQAAFERCVRFYGTAIYRVAWAHSLSKGDSDDIFQETFIALWRTGKKFESEEHIRRWLLKVASYKSKDALRAASRRAQGGSPLKEGDAERIAAPRKRTRTQRYGQSSLAFPKT